MRLRPLRHDDEQQARTAHAELAEEGLTFCLLLEEDMSWTDYLAVLERHRLGISLPEGYVPSTFLVAEVEGELVGRASIRHRLNEFLETEGGNIGYAVRRARRRRGYATEILRQSLIVARSLGVDRALLTCEVENSASAAVIERCGGKFDQIVFSERHSVTNRCYWID